jgi:uncharacterized protein (TIGR00369 family)
MTDDTVEFREGYLYENPATLAAAAQATDGLTVLRGIRDGSYPPAPISLTLGFRLIEVDHGRAVFEGTPAPWQYNPIGTVHGGVLSTLLDSAAGCAVHSTLPAGRGYTSLDLSVKFLRAVTVSTGKIAAHGRVLNSGRRTALAEAQIKDSNGKLIAHATSTCMLYDVTPGR